MNNFTGANAYTTKIPGGTLNKVQLTNPSNVKIQWPSANGNTKPTTIKKSTSFLRSIFG
jgi:hypothetical protein